ncbi:MULTISPECIES: ImmA/IrrE family metallo-endopeptidase [Stenotrophomonas]|uniref:ImmA/IrrE family metallo-endopeptidase n=1 Tax=Stenotrophomonas TaxID=40323 RepID=UPI00066E055A|nr:MULTISPECIES: ImmA/IrrE family metallo-endopeptidase [Stenotrophomonas]ELK2666190.1 ImmA/IrrE family metallo-endopeptidase [Stenotrophomonas maltophilia]MBH1377764.1 ImmA/IrrE family metallo-endopeptidase [Stenotrophomonas maltophilia]MBH1440452.1 ImmA/IrrE family metallo-endopeptidase [Stenotrophomonas maltophilia]MBH1559070.1 ImmA/IrrE family metallo-endopeptidase [Stenotrophomonas maltophilia]MBN4987268.1 ImmA/IrrE family metallo-endopeptidase [Stenotrophomonas maltophilia]
MGRIVFQEADITACLEHVLDIIEQYELYVLHGKGDVRSVDDLLWICTQYLNKKIVIEYVDIPVDGSSIKATFFANADGSYRIGLLSGMSDEEERFVLCKELFHVIFDEESRRSLDLAAHLEEYTSNIALDEGEPNCPAAWETLAEIAATEFLFPYERRVQSVANGSAADYGKLATRFQIPRLHVEIACGVGNLAYIGARLDAIMKRRNGTPPDASNDDDPELDEVV